MPSERDFVLHSWCVPGDWNAPTVVGGRGARLLLEDGREMLDMSSLVECSNLGHQHPKLVAAIKAQADRLLFVTSAWGAEPRRVLAERLLELSGFEGGRVFFTLGGADANENAVRIARQVSKKPRGLVVTRDRSYHGASYMDMALSGDSRTAHQVDADAWGVRHVPPPYSYRCPFGSANAHDCGVRAAEAVAKCIDAEGAARVAAVLMETDAGSNGIVPPDSYWPALRELTREREVLLIADEVMSAFGRCGEWFAWQRHGEAGRPDLMSLAKGLTAAAVPLGAVVMSAAVARRLEREMFYGGLTYCGHPAVLRSRRRRDRRLSRRKADRPLARPGRADVRAIAGACRPPSRDRRSARRPRAVRRRRARLRPRDPGAGRAVAVAVRRHEGDALARRVTRAFHSARAGIS